MGSSAPVFPESDRHFKRADGYQAGVLKAALPHITNFDLAIDVGAHVGLISRQMEGHFKRVVAFEPIESNRRCLVENTDRSKTTVYACGLSAAHCLKIMENPAPANSGAWEVVEDGPSGLPFFPLDDFNFAPGFIKVDVQGGEMSALMGAEKTIRQHRPILAVECERHGERDSLLLDYIDKCLKAKPLATVGKDVIFGW